MSKHETGRNVKHKISERKISNCTSVECKINKRKC